MFLGKINANEPIHSVECCEINENITKSESDIELYDMIAYGRYCYTDNFCFLCK